MILRILLFTLVACVHFVAWAVETTPVTRPNIILLLSDDQDWNGLSVRMHPDNPESRSDFFETPNLEKFAAQGMRFSNGYAPAPVCSPTRISLQTGMTPARLGWTKAAPAEMGYRLIEGDNRKAIRDDEVTFAELLRKTGYATAHFGKMASQRRRSRKTWLRRERWRYG
jgi:arylsulfatase A-like enzyme